MRKYLDTFFFQKKILFIYSSIVCFNSYPHAIVNPVFCCLISKISIHRSIWIWYWHFWLAVFVTILLDWGSMVKNHLFLLVIGVVIFIWAEFGATAIFRCEVIKPRAANCFAFIVDVAIVGTLLGLCCWMCGWPCCCWFTLTLRNCCGLKFLTFDAATSWAAIEFHLFIFRLSIFYVIQFEIRIHIQSHIHIRIHILFQNFLYIRNFLNWITLPEKRIFCKNNVSIPIGSESTDPWPCWLAVVKTTVCVGCPNETGIVSTIAKIPVIFLYFTWTFSLTKSSEILKF